MNLAKMNPFMNPFTRVECADAGGHHGGKVSAPIGGTKTIGLKNPIPGRTIMAAASGEKFVYIGLQINQYYQSYLHLQVELEARLNLDLQNTTPCVASVACSHVG